MAYIRYGHHLQQRKREIAAKKVGMRCTHGCTPDEFYVVVWHDPEVQQDHYHLSSELFPSREEALDAYNRIVSWTKGQAFDSNLDSFSSNAGSIGMSHVQHQHAARRILSELDEALLRRRQQTRRLFRGVVRATTQLLAAQRRAAERVYAPGAAGFEVVRTSFVESADKQGPPLYLHPYRAG